jgi:hypothetical protein
MASDVAAGEASWTKAALVRWAAQTALCFLAFAGAVLGGSEWLLRTRVAPSDAAQAHYRFFAAADAPDAAFGDSQMAFAFSGAPGFVNLAHLGEAAPTIRYKVETYYAERAPGRVILQANPSMFSAAYEKDDVEAQIARYRPGERLLLLAPEYRGELATYWRMFLTGQRFKPNVEFLPDGSRARNRKWAEKPAAQRRALGVEGAAFRQPMPAEEIRGSRSFAAFRETISYLLGRGARLCLVDAPVAPELAAAIATLPRYAAAQELIAETARGLGASYRDLHSHYDDAALFDDENHLNPAGAARFTAEVVQECFAAPQPAQRAGSATK